MRAKPGKETEGKKSIILVLQIGKEEKRIGEIKRSVIEKESVLPSRLFPSNHTNFMDYISTVFFAAEIPFFGLNREISELAIGVLARTKRAMADEVYEGGRNSHHFDAKVMIAGERSQVE